MPDFRLQPSFPIASVIDAAQRNAQLQTQAREAGNQSLLAGLKSIGDVAESLYDRKKRVAQSLALGKQFDIPDDLSRTMEPNQVIEAAKVKKGYEDADTFLKGLRAISGLPQAPEAPADQSQSGPAQLTKNPSPAHVSGAMLASDVSGTPFPSPVIDSGGLQPPTTGQVPVPIAAPPIQPQANGAAATNATPAHHKMVSPLMQRLLMSEAIKAADAKRPIPVMTQADALNAGYVPKGTKVITEHGNPEDFQTFIGNDSGGNPLFADKQGNIMRGRVPVAPSAENAPKTGGPVLPKSSTMPTSSTRSSAEFAQTIIPHIQTMRDLIQEADQKGYIGPAAGRVYNQFMAGKIGSTGSPDADRVLGRLRANDSLLKTGAMRVHFGARGGQQMYDHFSDMLNTGKQSAAMLNGSLDTIQDFMQGYANAGTPGGAANAAPPPAASSPTSPTWSAEKEQRFQELLDKRAGKKSVNF